MAAKNDANRDVLAALSALAYDTLTGATREQISWSRRNRGVLGIFFFFILCLAATQAGDIARTVEGGLISKVLNLYQLI